MKTPLWKVSLAVWLPILFLGIVSYAIAYKIKYDKAKVNHAYIASQCEKGFFTPNNPNSNPCNRNTIEHGFLYLPN